MSEFNGNEIDPDQTPQNSAASDLGLHSLPGIIVLQELSLRLSIFQFRSVSINSL